MGGDRQDLQGNPEVGLAREEFLAKMLGKLDQNDAGQRALALCLKETYSEVVEQDNRNAAYYDCGFRENYYAKSGVKKGYAVEDIVDAVRKVSDLFGIFPAISQAIVEGETSELPDRLANLITNRTGIPVLWGTPGTFYDSTKSDPVEANMVPIGNGKYVYVWANEKEYDLYGNLASVEVERNDPNIPFKFRRINESAIVLNRSRISEPELLQTPFHELGHVALEKLGLSRGEVYPSLYGLRAAMEIAKRDVDLAAKIMGNPVNLYNWVIFGTSAPY